MAATAFFAFSPTTLSSAANTTSLPRCSDSLLATGARLSSGLGSPFGLPRCEQRMTLPPSAMSFLMVGRAATIRFSSVISPFLSGTLKSQRTRTRLPFTLRSSTVFLFNTDIVIHPFRMNYQINNYILSYFASFFKMFNTKLINFYHIYYKCRTVSRSSGIYAADLCSAALENPTAAAPHIPRPLLCLKD